VIEVISTLLADSPFWCHWTDLLMAAAMEAIYRQRMSKKDGWHSARARTLAQARPEQLRRASRNLPTFRSPSS